MEFPDALTACSTLEAVQLLFSAEIATYGFTVCACGAFLPTDKGPVPYFFFQDWPPDWIRLYQARNFVAIDYGVAEARRRIAPFTWSEVRAERVLSRDEQELWDTAVSWGWAEGFSVPIHGPGGYFALVTMGGNPGEIAQGLRSRLHLYSFMVHERCRTLTGLSPVAAPQARLTSRELECLRWVAAGKTDWEIATIMGLSQTTVKTHVDHGRRKLGARTRPQAVARLVLSGLS